MHFIGIQSIKPDLQQIENILFLDIETVPETQYQRKDDYSAEEFYDRAGIWAEFGIIDRIIIYCEKDTIAVAQIFLRLRGDEILSVDEILHI